MTQYGGSKSMEDTFDALRRTPIQEMDKVVLDALHIYWDVPGSTLDTNEVVELQLTKKDLKMLHLVLQPYHWTVEQFLKHTRIVLVLTP
jgi:hypothetical protein